MFSFCVLTTLRARTLSTVRTLLEEGPSEPISPVSPIRDKYGILHKNQSVPSFPYRISEFSIDRFMT